MVSQTCFLILLSVTADNQFRCKFYFVFIFSINNNNDAFRATVMVFLARLNGAHDILFAGENGQCAQSIYVL